ncbi:MAG: hypothetical protein N2588_11055 [Rhodovarius sp.]|nr:hypothetical protein [Rhodovarius sp.]MCX7933072.1 hypothetical protein [Rhodovarius sp.]
MTDLRISQLPAAVQLSDGDLAPLSQMGPQPTTRRASIAQLRAAMHEGRSVHVQDFGAVGDGVANDAPAIQAAIDHLKTRGGGIVQFGPRRYRLGGPVTVSGVTVRLQGAGFTEGPGPDQGTWLIVNSAGFTPITFTGLAARGSVVADLAVFEQHPAASGPGWAPTGYDWFFRIVDCLGGVDFENLFLCAVHKGIYCYNSGRSDFRRIRGQVFAAGIEVDQALDVPRLHNIHFWPFWSSSVHVVDWQQAHGDALIFKRCDGPFIDQAFALGYRSLFRFTEGAAGRTTKFYIGQAYADFCRYGIHVDAEGVDGQVANLTTHHERLDGSGDPLPNSHAILVAAPHCRIQIGNLRVDAVQDHALHLASHSGRIDLFALRVVRYNTRNNGAAAIQLAQATTGEPNRVFLGSPPVLESPTPGPLANAGSNGVVQMQGPAGSAAAPGLAVGEQASGLFRPAPQSLALSAGGQEVLRATPGSVAIGGGPGAQGFAVSTPGGTVNHLQAHGAVAGAAPVLEAAGQDAAIGLTLRSKGAAAQSFATGGGVQMQVLHTADAINTVQVSGAATGNPAAVGWRAAGADAHVAAVIGQPRGQGALLAQFPDGTAAGGAVRGAQAVDLQLLRSSPSQVASGAQAVLAGGQNNTASGNQAVVGGGSGNTASGATSTVAGGINNVASATSATIAGGTNNTVSQQRSWCPGGERSTSRANSGRGAWAAGRFATDGDAQAGEFVLRASSTGNAAVRLTSDGQAPSANNTLNLPNNGTYRLSLLVVAQQTAGSAGTAGDCAAWTVDVLIRRGANAAATVLVGGHARQADGSLAAVTAGAPLPPDQCDAAAAAWRISVAADTSQGGLALSATGEANKTIRWVARALSIEVTA